MLVDKELQKLSRGKIFIKIKLVDKKRNLPNIYLKNVHNLYNVVIIT